MTVKTDLEAGLRGVLPITAGINAAGHLTIGDDAHIAAKSGIHGDVPARAEYGGYPAIEARLWRRAMASLTRLPDVFRRVRRVERALGLAAGDDEE